MKKISVLFVVLVLSMIMMTGCGESSTDNNDQRSEGSASPQESTSVGELETRTYSFSDGSKRVITYNESGQEITAITYNSVGNVIAQTDNSYDSDGNIMMTSVQYSNGSLEEYKYDSAGNQIGYAQYSNGNMVYNEEASYDDNGNMLSHVKYDSDGSVASHEEYTYDDDGNQLTFTEYNSDDKINKRLETNYDESGNKLSSTSYDNDGKVTEENAWTYDEDGNMLSSIKREYDSLEELCDEETCTYQNGNLQTKKTSSSNGSWSEETYDSDGNLIAGTSVDKYGFVKKY